jgi:hypothetical protein
MSRLAATPRRNGFALLRTVSSPPVAPHHASQRMQLPSASGLLAFPGADSHRADTRHRGRTHSRANGNPGRWRRVFALPFGACLHGTAQPTQIPFGLPPPPMGLGTGLVEALLAHRATSLTNPSTGGPSTCSGPAQGERCGGVFYPLEIQQTQKSLTTACGWCGQLRVKHPAGGEQARIACHGAHPQSGK